MLYKEVKRQQNWGSNLAIKTRVFLANFEHQRLATTIIILAKFDHKGF
jgi:hypothetical protein